MYMYLPLNSHCRTHNGVHVIINVPHIASQAVQVQALKVFMDNTLYSYSAPDSVSTKVHKQVPAS